MKLETLTARRYLTKNEKGAQASLLAIIGMAGIVLSVFALLLVQFVMTGFSQDIRGKILRFSSPLVIKPLNPELYSGKIPPPLPTHINTSDLHPYLETEGVIRSPDDVAQGLKMKGVELNDPMLTQKLKVDYVEGFSSEDLISKEETLPGILLGTELAKRLNVFPSLNEEVDLIYPFGDVDPSGEMRPKTRRFRVIGTFKSGYYEYDNKFALIALPEARRLIPFREVPTEWALDVPNFFEAPQLAKALNQSFSGQYLAKNWGEHNKKLLSALRLERFTMWMVLGLMIVISTFNIFSLVMMIVVDKQKEIAIFRAMGLGRKRVTSIFTRIGMILGVGGTLLGSLLAMATALFLKWQPLKLPSPYYLDYLPVKIDLMTLVFVMILAPLLSILAAWYPAYRGGRFDLSETLRYE